MSTDEESFADVIRAIIGNRTQRRVAQMGDVSHTYISDWLQGNKPTPKKLTVTADNWEAAGILWPELRERLFRAARYYDPKQPTLGSPATTYEPVWEEVTVRAFRQGRDLPETDQAELDEVFRLMIEQRRRQRGLD